VMLPREGDPQTKGVLSLSLSLFLSFFSTFLFFFLAYQPKVKCDGFGCTLFSFAPPDIKGENVPYQGCTVLLK